MPAGTVLHHVNYLPVMHCKNTMGTGLQAAAVQPHMSASKLDVTQKKRPLCWPGVQVCILYVLCHGQGMSTEHDSSAGTPGPAQVECSCCLLPISDEDIPQIT